MNIRFIYILLFVCSATFSQTTYHVNYAIGSNANDGSSGSPWKTRGKSFAEADTPGDTVYFHDDAVYIDTAKTVLYSGTEANPICFFAYPGDSPIFDFATVRPSEDTYNRAFHMQDKHYLHFKGLTIRNVLQPNGQGGEFPENGTKTIGMNIGYADSVIVENCTFHNVSGIGLLVLPKYDHNHTWIINCDAYNIIDTLSYPDQYIAGRGTGFRESHDYNTWGTTIGKTYFIGCRAWNCSDQGFSLSLDGYGKADSCWSFANGFNDPSYPTNEGNGHGFKLGFFHGEKDSIRKEIHRCIAALNHHNGFTTNDDSGFSAWRNIYNTMSYGNNALGDGRGDGYEIFTTTDTDVNENKRIFRNNTAFENVGDQAWVDTYPATALYAHSNNTWDGGATVTAADFAVVHDSATVYDQLIAARSESGLLPELTIFKLAQGSDLIDAGVDVGLDYLDSAPDIGPFEFITPGEPPGVGYKLSSGTGKLLSTGTGKVMIGR